MTPIKQVETLFVFCEGPHDVAFLRQVFKYNFAMEQQEGKEKGLKIADYPAPLNRVLAAMLKNYPIESMPLGMGKAFLFPSKALFSRDFERACILMSCGGSSFFTTVREFLARYLPQHENRATFNKGAKLEVARPKYLFIQDADEKGKPHFVKKVCEELKDIGNKPFLSIDTPSDGQHEFGSILAPDKALYIWGSTPQKGTLEDLIIPMLGTALQEKDIALPQINQALVSVHPFNTETVAQRSKKNKALIALAGQKKKPGGAVHDIIDQAKLIPDNLFRQDQLVLKFVDFIRAFTAWSGDGEREEGER